MNLVNLKNKKILLFGKSRAFSPEEFLAQLTHHNISSVKEFDEDVAFVVDGRMMTPYEQNASEALYEEAKAEFLSIDALEEELAKEIDEDTLLMSLKLSHDKERLKSFLQNSMISDKLFFRLLKMYSWGDEDFFENDDNRDVSAAFIGRFYENIERNHNVQYATTGFIHLVAQAKNSELLKEISLLKPLSYHPKIAVAIAMNIHCDEALQKRYFKLGGENIHEALSYNKNLAPSLVSEFLKDEELAHNVAISVKLSEELFELLLSMPTYLAQNETLTLEMQERLLSLKTPELNLSLAFNNNLNAKTIDALLALNDAKITQTVYENNATPEAILTEAYKDEKNHLALSKNENTPIEILYQLQLDSRYERHVKTNAGYGRHIQTQNIGWLV